MDSLIYGFPEDDVLTSFLHDDASFFVFFSYYDCYSFFFFPSYYYNRSNLAPSYTGPFLFYITFPKRGIGCGLFTTIYLYRVPKQADSIPNYTAFSFLVRFNTGCSLFLLSFLLYYVIPLFFFSFLFFFYFYFSF